MGLYRKKKYGCLWLCRSIWWIILGYSSSTVQMVGMVSGGDSVSTRNRHAGATRTSDTVGYGHPAVSNLRRFQATKATLIRFDELFGPFSTLAFLLSTLAFLLSTLAFLLSSLLWCRDDCTSRCEPAQPA